MERISTLLLVITIVLMTGYVQQTYSDEAKGQLPAVSFHMADLQGNLDAVRQHIEFGSDLNGKDAYGSTPLIIAVTFGKTDVAGALIDAGADLEIRDNNGSTPLHLATFFCRPEIFKDLLAHGADRFLRNNSGSTAFDIAVSPFDDDKELYDSIGQALGPLGLELEFSINIFTRHYRSHRSMTYFQLQTSRN